MTTLADLTVGDAFVAVGIVTAQDQVTGDTISLFGPNAVPQGTLVISPVGVFSGQLAAAANQIPVQPAPEFFAVSVGELLQNSSTGETMVAMRVEIQPDGTYRWSSSTTGPVWYPMDGWVVTGNATFS